MKLSVLDRLRLPEILPRQGGILDMKVRDDIISKISFSDDERDTLNLRVDSQTGQVVWNPGINPIEIEFGKSEIELIVSSLRKHDEEKTITPDDINLWDVFLGGK